MKKEEIENIQKEIMDLIYDKPKCDFEHTWNCAIMEAHDCLNGYEEE